MQRGSQDFIYGCKRVQPKSLVLIFCLVVSIHSASCLCSTLVFHIPAQNFVSSSASGGFALFELSSKLLKNLAWLVLEFLLS